MPITADQIIKGIDRSIQIAVNDGRTCISVHLPWIYYRELLAVKGIEWERKDLAYDAQYRDRPLKMYRFWPLYLQPENNPQSWVQWPKADGGCTLLTIRME